MKFGAIVQQTGSTQRAKGMFTPNFLSADKAFAGSQAAMNASARAMAHAVANSPFKNNPFDKPHHGHPGGTGAGGPVKRLMVPAHPGGVGGIIAKAAQGGGGPGVIGGGVGGRPPRRRLPGPHDQQIDQPGGNTFWSFVEWVLQGMIRVGDVILLTIQGAGDILIRVNEQVVQATRSAARTFPPHPTRDGGIAFEHWLNEHWIIASTGIGLVLAAILGAAIN